MKGQNKHRAMTFGQIQSDQNGVVPDINKGESVCR